MTTVSTSAFCIHPYCPYKIGSRAARGEKSHPRSCGNPFCEAYAEGFEAGQVTEAKRQTGAYSQALTADDYERSRKALYTQAVNADARAAKFLELLAMIADHVDPVFCSIYMERRDVEPWLKRFAAADFEVFKMALPYMAEAFEDEMKSSPRQAAVAYIEHYDGKDARLLCVWNRRYGGWSLPGGLVEEGESVPQALARELREETSLVMVTHESIFSGEHNLKANEEAREGRASMVHIYRVEATGEARECEDGCPVTWLTRNEFLKWSPFAPFYTKVFAAVAERGK